MENAAQRSELYDAGLPKEVNSCETSANISKFISRYGNSTWSAG